MDIKHEENPRSKILLNIVYIQYRRSVRLGAIKLSDFEDHVREGHRTTFNRRRIIVKQPSTQKPYQQFDMS